MKCTATLKCIVNRTEMRQTGYGYELVCPTCGFKYDPEKKEEEPKSKKDKSTDYMDIIRRKFTI